MLRTLTLRRTSSRYYSSPPSTLSFSATTTRATAAAAFQKNDNSLQKLTHLPQSYTHDTLLHNKKVLIANRGEIAMRIARAAKSLGAISLSVCAPEDVSSPHVEYADEHFVLEKGETAIAPYLNIEKLTKVAVENGVDFVHPCNCLFYCKPFSKPAE